MQREIISSILLMVSATLIHAEISLESIIAQCEWETKEFAAMEYRYVDTTKGGPYLEPAQNKELQPVIYQKEILQRTFECITERTNLGSQAALVKNPKYQELVFQCKSQQSQPLCDPFYPYRTFDGTCNNLLFPKHGSTLTCLSRLTEQNYQGVAGFRQSVCGKPLPDPRDLSMKVLIDVNKPTSDVSHMNTFFGQFLAHDISDTPLSSINGKSIACCSSGECDLHPQCVPMLMKENDPYYYKYNVTCLNLHRTAMCDTCSVGKRLQMNQQTSYIDLSTIYGVTDTMANSLRRKDGSGKLKVYKNGTSGDLLPRKCPSPDSCSDKTRQYSFNTGDERGNLHIPLTTLHTLFHLEHNRIAEELKWLNPHWDEEKLFQEARKINIAQFQSINYKEHLPAIIGSNLMLRYNLSVASGQTRTIYDPFEDATLFIEFNTAGYRLHSTVNGIATNYDIDDGKCLFKDMVINPIPLYHDQMSSLVKGVCISPAQKNDRFMAEVMTDTLVKRPSGVYGFNIGAVNIQRGRDNGLPTYTEMLSHLWGGTINIQCFDDLQLFMDKENIEVLRRNYCDVKDIDLWVGLVNERVPVDRVVGPTAAELIALQYRNLKFGDRFYFEHSGNFNNQQLETLKRATLSSVLCSNTKIKAIQLEAHRFPSPTNPITLCEDIPKIDLFYWKDGRI